MQEIKWVDAIPPRKGGGKKSRWSPVVDQLLANPGRAAVIFTGQTWKETEAARHTFASHVKTRGANIAIRVRKNSIYAVAVEAEEADAHSPAVEGEFA